MRFGLGADKQRDRRPGWPSLEAMLRDLVDSLEHGTPMAGRSPIVGHGALDWAVVLDAEADATLAAWRPSQERS
ncbi:MAG: hypothetical protein QOH29_1069 [Actinomycetota bacterium]|jgi:hypothetical protein|nr:hypothetical protein [Actinomycetota bacterium]